MAADAARLPVVRPFEHRRHESVSCRVCHGAGDQHRTLLIRGPLDCASCHHDAARAGTCADCHTSDQLPNDVRVAVTLELGVWDSARTRELPFGHERHAGRQCRECHATPVTLAMNEQCGACHESHHTAAANCAGCHERVERSAHPAAAHLSCDGGGCHAANVAPAPTLSRNLCIACHTDRAEHEPEGSCAECHGIRSRGAVP